MSWEGRGEESGLSKGLSRGTETIIQGELSLVQPDSRANFDHRYLGMLLHDAPQTDPLPPFPRTEPLPPPLIRIKTVPVFDNTTAGVVFLFGLNAIAWPWTGRGGPCLPCLPFPLSFPSFSKRFQSVLSISNVLENVVNNFQLVYFFTGIY